MYFGSKFPSRIEKLSMYPVTSAFVSDLLQFTFLFPSLVPGRPTILITVGQGPTALAVGADGGLFGHFYSHLSFLFSFSLSLGDGPI